MKIIKFQTPLYFADVTYLIGGTVKDLRKYLDRIHGKDHKTYNWDKSESWAEDADSTDGYQFHVPAPLGDGEVFYVWVARPAPSLIFHETFHLVGDILHNRGIAYSYDSEEAYAYLGGWIFDKIFSKVRKILVKE